MWRAIPLLKMVMRMVAGCIALSVVSQVLIIWTIWGQDWRLMAIVLVMLKGVMEGLILGLPMAVATIIFFRKIRRPLFYRFAMMTVAMIISLEVWTGFTLWHLQNHLQNLDLSRMSKWIPVLVIVLVGDMLRVYWSQIAAGKYLRETWQRQF